MRRIQSFKKWSLRFALVAIVIYFIIAMFGDWYTTQYLKQNALKFQRADAAEMVALTPDKAALIAQRKRAELINLIWEKETGKWSPKEGEIAPTFDPIPSSTNPASALVVTCRRTASATARCKRRSARCSITHQKCTVANSHNEKPVTSRKVWNLRSTSLSSARSRLKVVCGIGLLPRTIAIT